MQATAAGPVVAAIEAAFPDPRPEVREAVVYPGSWETMDLIDNLAKVEDAPTPRFIEWHASSLAEFTPFGFRHVLPFYLRYSLDKPQSDVTERIIFHLAPDDAESPYWKERVAAFSTLQKQAVCQYVRCMEERALRRVFCQSPTRVGMRLSEDGGCRLSYMCLILLL